MKNLRAVVCLFLLIPALQAAESALASLETLTIAKKKQEGLACLFCRALVVSPPPQKLHKLSDVPAEGEDDTDWVYEMDSDDECDEDCVCGHGKSNRAYDPLEVLGLRSADYAVKKTKVCGRCFMSVEENLMNQLGRENYYIDTAVEVYTFLLNGTESRKSIPGFVRTSQTMLYVGAKQLENGNLLHLWKKEIFQIAESDKKRVDTWEDALKHVKKIFEKYPLVGPETGTPFEGDIPEDAVMFEEQIQKAQ